MITLTRILSRFHTACIDSTGGIGRPKGDVGREFAKSGEIRSFAVTDDDAKKSEQQQQQQQRQRTFVAYGDKMKFEETASEQAHKRNVEVIKKLPESAKPSLIGEEKFDAKKKTKVPQSVRYKCLYRLVAIRLEEYKNEKDAEVITRLVNEASEREFDCFENSRDKQTYLSKVAQFKSSESFQNLKDLMHPKGAEKQNDSSETARKISLELCREVRGVESIKFFARAARRASGF